MSTKMNKIMATLYAHLGVELALKMAKDVEWRMQPLLKLAKYHRTHSRPGRPFVKSVANQPRSRSKYTPHQGVQECERRLRQASGHE